MRILVSYRGIPQSPGWATGDMVVKALRELGHEVMPYAKYYGQKESWVETLSQPCPWINPNYVFDLVLFMECNDEEPQYTELRDRVKTRKTVCWLFDTSYYPDGCEGLVRWFNFDHVFLANPTTQLQYRSVGIDNTTYLPYACDPDLHFRELSTEKKISIALFGSVRADRLALQSNLSDHGIRMDVIGDRFREKYIDSLASADIIINQNPSSGRGLLNMRWFEAPAAGSIVLGEEEDAARNPVFQGWDLGYKSVEDLAIMCNNYLSNRTSLVITQGNLQQHVLGHHTYRNRCETILKTVFPHGI
jgi:hypothetical protein